MNQYVEEIERALKSFQYCFIDDAVLESYARSVACSKFEIPSWRWSPFPKSDDNIIDFFGVADSINACFTDFATGKSFDVEYPFGTKPYEGSMALAASITRALDEGVPVLDANYLATITKQDARNIFRHVTTPIPMLNERVASLRSVGKYMQRVGTFRDIFEKANYYAFNSGRGIVEIIEKGCLAYMDYSFCVVDNKQIAIPFFKRLQLFVMMYHGRTLSSNGVLCPIRDPEHIGPITDYRVPQCLRHQGTLIYSKELARIVDTKQVIERNSRMEVEIRVQTTRAMKRSIDIINEERAKYSLPPITIVEYDYHCFSFARKNKDMLLPHQWVYSTAY